MTEERSVTAVCAHLEVDVYVVYILTPPNQCETVVDGGTSSPKYPFFLDRRIQSPEFCNSSAGKTLRGPML